MGLEFRRRVQLALSLTKTRAWGLSLARLAFVLGVVGVLCALVFLA